ncbi:MAG TPA: DUF4272 domain-containing protein, partial [Pirellulales bacterium]|nr:DUF4272 domain-containing protein [Pirellulales bacterium]
PRQVFGMQAYFSEFPEGSTKSDVLRLISTFRFALATDWQPDLNADGDERLQFLFAVARHLDAALFTPSSLRDAEGRVLLSAGGECDADAILPKMPPVEPVGNEGDDGLSDDELAEPVPPTPQRVARRALALAAVTARALLEQDDPIEPWVTEFHRDTLQWIEDVGIGDELEPDEWKVLQRPPGTLDERAQIEATWRLEGLVVLAWALNRFDMPSHDALVNPQDLIRSLGFNDAVLARELLEASVLRTADELEVMRKQLLGLHWRLRNFGLRPEAMDFLAFSKNCWFGHFDISPFRLINNDLAIGGFAISDAPQELVQLASSCAMERHQAINWLTEGGVYSETDTST